MVFTYRRVVISGTAEGVEGVSAGMSAISTFMQDCGWNLVEDRTSQPGASLDADAPKLVLSSNGEEGNYPTFFITLTSGIAAAANANYMYLSASTAYDTGTHTTPASGTDTRNGANVSDSNGDNKLQIRSQDDNTELIMSGDSEMVHVISRKANDNNSTNTMDNVYYGRFNSFMPVDENPYPVIVSYVSGNTIHAEDVTYTRGIWGNPPASSASRGHVSLRDPGILDTNMPHNIGVDSIFTALPLMVCYEQSTSVVKGVVGTVRNGWVSSDRTHLLNQSVLTASGTQGEQLFESFTNENTLTTKSIIIRKS